VRKFSVFQRRTIFFVYLTAAEYVRWGADLLRITAQPPPPNRRRKSSPAGRGVGVGHRRHVLEQRRIISVAFFQLFDFGMFFLVLRRGLFAAAALLNR